MTRLDFKKRKIDFHQRRLIPRREYPKPFRFVGIGIIVMVVLIFILYKLIVK